MEINPLLERVIRERASDLHLTVGLPPVMRRHGRLQYMASNPVGDAVLLYAMVQGRLWAEAERRIAR